LSENHGNLNPLEPSGIALPLPFTATTTTTTTWSRVLDKLTGSLLVKNVPAFCGTRRLITTFTTARHLSLSWARSSQSVPPPPHHTSLIIHFDITIPSLPRSSKWSPCRRLSHHNCMHLSSPHTWFITRVIFGEVYWA
jgi:hypothetical protein